MTSARLREILSHEELGNKAAEAALVTLYALQEADEQASGTTKKQNGKGFNSTDANFGSSLAEQVLGSLNEPGNKLSPRQFASAKSMLVKYHSQLNESNLLPAGEYLELPLILQKDLEEMIQWRIKETEGVIQDWREYLEQDLTAGEKLVNYLKECIEMAFKAKS